MGSNKRERSGYLNVGQKDKCHTGSISVMINSGGLDVDDHGPDTEG